MTNQKINDKIELNSTESTAYERNLSISSNLSIASNLTIASNELNIDFNLLRKEILTLYSILTGISFFNALGQACKISDSMRTKDISVKEPRKGLIILYTQDPLPPNAAERLRNHSLQKCLGLKAKLKQFILTYKCIFRNVQFLRLLSSYGLVHGTLGSFYIVARITIGEQLSGDINLNIGLIMMVMFVAGFIGSGTVW